MTVDKLITELAKFRRDDPVVIEVDNSNCEIEEWKDTYDFTITTERLDEDYTEIRLKLIPN